MRPSAASSSVDIATAMPPSSSLHLTTSRTIIFTHLNEVGHCLSHCSVAIQLNQIAPHRILPARQMPETCRIQACFRQAGILGPHGPGGQIMHFMFAWKILMKQLGLSGQKKLVKAFLRTAESVFRENIRVRDMENRL